MECMNLRCLCGRRIFPAEHQVQFRLPIIRPLEVDLNGREAAVFGGMLCGSNEADDAELIGDQVKEEAGGQTNEQLDEGHGKDVAGGLDNIGEARQLRIPNDPGRPTRREVEEHIPFLLAIQVLVQTLPSRKVCRKSS